MNRPRVLLADDHAMVREGLMRVLEPHVEVVAAVGDGRAAVTETERLRPDVTLLDIGLPLLNGVEAGAQIHAAAPDSKIIFLSQQSGKEYVQAAFRIGGSGYILKNAAAAELVTGIAEVLAGNRYLSVELRQRYGDIEPAPNGGTDRALFSNNLTPRQREVLQLVAEGKTAKEIAQLLNISTKTVEFHKAAVMDELGMRTTAELTRYAIEQGMLPST